MIIYDLDNINKVDEFYDLTQLTFNFTTEQPFGRYVVQTGEEMRIDLVCQSIYGNTDFVDLLCSLNNIDNPLNVRVDQEIIYPIDNFEIYRYSEPNSDDTLTILANSNKLSRKDPNRKEYLENNLALPPTILKKRTNQFNIDSKNIILGRGLF